MEIPEQKKSQPSQLETFIVGLSTFDASMPAEIRNELIRKPRKIEMLGRQYHIFFRNFQSWKWNQIFHHMVSSQCSSLQIQEAETTEVLIALLNPTFTHLQNLYLFDNRITSIELLSFIKAEHLKLLYLHSNLITNVKGLNKTKWTKLEEIYLEGNPIEQKEISRMDLAHERFIIHDLQLSPYFISRSSYDIKTINVMMIRNQLRLGR